MMSFVTLFDLGSWNVIPSTFMQQSQLRSSTKTYSIQELDPDGVRRIVWSSF